MKDIEKRKEKATIRLEIEDFCSMGSVCYICYKE
jgi:hypothetical protein